MQSEDPRIGVFAIPAGYSGCAFWRFRRPLGKLMEVGSEKVNVYMANNPNKTIAMADIEHYAQVCQLVHMQAPGHKDAHKLMMLYRQHGKGILIDYDDFSFDLDPGNPRYMDLGLQETEAKDDTGKVAFKWRQGENGFDVAANRSKYEAFIQCVRDADLVTVTTDYLADKFRKETQKVVVLPNSIDFALWKPIVRPARMKDEVRIGWFGGDSHFADVKMLGPLFESLVAKYTNVKIVLQCPRVPQWMPIFERLGTRLEWHDWADLRYYTLFLASRQWDIGLCPLADTEFNRCKSNIKCLEFAALGAAVVAQDMIPYSNHVQPGITGLLAGNPQQWFEAVCRLIEDVAYRRQLAKASYDDAFERYNLDKNCKLWERAYCQVYAGLPKTPVATPMPNFA